MDAIEVKGLTKYYGDVRGVEDLSFTVTEGEIFGFLGPNGSGKTTAIRTMLGFLKPTEGNVGLLEYDAFNREELLEAKENIGYVSGESAFYEDFTGNELLDYYAELKGGERTEELVGMFEPPLERKVGEYSRGNKQKLALVQAFMHSPDLVIMDEPTSGLDPLMQNTFYEFIEKESENGVTFFFSSHILSEVRRVCDRVGIIRQGELVALEDIESLISKSGKIVSAQFESEVPENDFNFEGVSSIETDGDSLTLVLTGNYDELVDRLANHKISDLEIREASLDDVFLHFYGFDEPRETIGEDTDMEVD